MVAAEHITISPCRAYGTLTTRSGRKAKWNIGIYRDGILIWDDGRSERVHLYCSDCKAPFAE